MKTIKITGAIKEAVDKLSQFEDYDWLDEVVPYIERDSEMALIDYEESLIAQVRTDESGLHPAETAWAGSGMRKQNKIMRYKNMEKRTKKEIEEAESTRQDEEDYAERDIDGDILPEGYYA